MLLLLLLLQVHVTRLLLWWGWWWSLSVLQIVRVLAVGHYCRIHAGPIITISLACTSTIATSSTQCTPAHVLLLLLHEGQHFTATLIPSHSTAKSTTVVVIIESTSVHVIESWRWHTRPHWPASILHLLLLLLHFVLCRLLLLLLLRLLLALHRLTLNQLGQTLLCLEKRIESWAWKRRHNI